MSNNNFVKGHPLWEMCHNVYMGNESLIYGKCYCIICEKVDKYMVKCHILYGNVSLVSDT